MQTQKKSILSHLSQWNNRANAYKNIIANLDLTQAQLIDYIKADVIKTSTLVSSV